jgi:hypothetical protein
VSLLSIPVKTPEGLVEMTTRQRRLSQRHRTVMFLVDGRRNLAEVQRMALAAGAPAELWEELLRMGLVALPADDNFAEAAIAAGSDTSASEGPNGKRLTATDIELDDSLLPPVPPLSSDSSVAPLTELPLLQAAMEAHTGQSAGSQRADVGPVEQARDMLVRALKDEAPVTGSLTLLRVRRAKSAAEIAGLLDEVELRISKPNRTLVTQQLLSNVRQLLIVAGSQA